MSRGVHWDEQIAGYDHEIEHISQQNKLCIILMAIPGIGPKVATALVAAVNSITGVRWPPGWGWFPDNTRPQARPDYWESVNAAIVPYAPY